MAVLVDRALRLALAATRRKAKPRGVLLVSARGPADMVFLSAVLPRFMRLAEDFEDVTLLMRSDAVGMSFLFPRSLRILRVEFRRLASFAYRWQIFRKLYLANYRLVVALDYNRAAEPDEALIAAAQAPEVAAMKPAPSGAPAKLIEATLSKYTKVFDPGNPNQDKVVRWSRFADFLSGRKQPPALALLPEARLPEAMPFEIPTVVVFPFSAVRQRQLLPEMWEAILNALPRDWQVRVAGHRADIDRNPQYKPLLERPRVTIDTSGFDHLASVLRGARMVIGADTAGVHLSILLGVPTLVLASAAFVGAGVPYDDEIIPPNAHFLHVPMECQGCMGRCPFEPIQGMLPCVAQINPDTVLGAVSDMIARGGY
ncbi:MAG: lipopolysaccharide heptosyltransferase family protein [Pseudomonadota bacterium]